MMFTLKGKGRMGKTDMVSWSCVNFIILISFKCKVEGIKKYKDFVDVVYGWPLRSSPIITRGVGQNSSLAWRRNGRWRTAIGSLGLLLLWILPSLVQVGRGREREAAAAIGDGGDRSYAGIWINAGLIMIMKVAICSPTATGSCSTSIPGNSASLARFESVRSLLAASVLIYPLLILYLNWSK